jgi:hypothetical protein
MENDYIDQGYALERTRSGKRDLENDASQEDLEEGDDLEEEYDLEERDN